WPSRHGRRLTPLFRSPRLDKLWGRKFPPSYPKTLEAGGVACRNNAGAWQVLIETGLAAAAPASPGSYPPAGPLPSDSEGILDSVRSRVKQGDVLGREEEEELVAEHWERK